MDSTQYDSEWDAGEMGCGELVLLLATRMRAMQPGQVLKLTALDEGAHEDIPAWCRMTRHALIAKAHPNYFIQRREGP